jgi:hypothetical protein
MGNSLKKARKAAVKIVAMMLAIVFSETDRQAREKPRPRG